MGTVVAAEIREATEADLARIVDMGEQFIETTYKALIRGDRTQMEALVWRLITGDDSSLLVATQGDRLIGMIGCYLMTHPISAERVATELFWWVDPSTRGVGVRLLRRVQAWAKSQGAVKLIMVAPSSRVADFYRVLGFTEVETAFQKEL